MTWRGFVKKLTDFPDLVTEWMRVEQTNPDRWRDVLEAQRMCEHAALSAERTDKVIGAAFNRQMRNGGRWLDNVLVEIKAEVRHADPV